MRRFVISALLLASTAHADRPPSPEAKVYLDRGLDKFDTKDYAGAIAEADRVLEVDPGEVIARLARAEAKEKLGRTAAAIEDYEAALRRLPEGSGDRSFVRERLQALAGK